MLPFLSAVVPLLGQPAGQLERPAPIVLGDCAIDLLTDRLDTAEASDQPLYPYYIGIE